MYNLWLHRFAVLVAACTLLLVVAGALVTSNDAGLSVPDWPLSYGRLMPEMKGGVFYEHGHRMVATTVGLLTILLAVWLWRADERRWLKHLGLAALAAVILQGVLGGLTVIYLLPAPVSISHACLAQSFFSTTVAIAVFTSRSWRQGAVVLSDTAWPSLRKLTLACPLVVLAQLALGAAYRHKVLGIVPHVAGAMGVTALILLTGIYVLLRYGSHGPLRRSAVVLLSAAFVQVFLGLAAYMSRVATALAPQPLPAMVAATAAHVAVGALTMAASVVLAIQAFRNLAPAVEIVSRSVTVTS
jgi:cytochrome c oxidase assembly protein subunit 15